jgi:integrase
VKTKFGTTANTSIVNRAPTSSISAADLARLQDFCGSDLDNSEGLRFCRVVRHDMPAHHQIEETIDEYLSKVSIEDKQPLFQSVNKAGTALSGRALNRYNAWTAVRKRARNAGFLTPVGCHTWRATGVTVYLENGGRLEHAQHMAAHEKGVGMRLAGEAAR